MTTKEPLDQLGYGFISGTHVPHGEDEYYLRNEQSRGGPYRRLTDEEIARLEANGNRAVNWHDVQVEDGFDPDLVQGSRFYGLVRIRRLEPYYLTYHDLRVPVGIYDSTIISSDIGTNTSIMKVGYLSHYIVRDQTIISQVDEIACTNHSKFGNGIVKEGEPEDVRIWIELGNENGGRKVLPFDGMTSADAYLWYKHRQDERLMERFKAMTEQLVDSRRGYYGVIGSGAVIKSCRIIKDVLIGDSAYIKGANKLKNLTINSSAEEPSQIGEGVEMVNGIIEPGCRVFYGVKAVRFYLAAHASLKYGARLLNSYLGENSTISCCEVLNSLILPSHEQHHNNSFLCAAALLGQSNLAAGATLGSNHNSRSNDGEVVAGRGFWPALCVSIKHNCRFASFALLTKADYPAEMRIPLPFALVSRDETENRLVIMPAYWFLHNMYALARNSWKFKARDKRSVRKLLLETDYLAPDTAEEMLSALDFLEKHVGKELLASPEGNEPFALPHGMFEKSRRSPLLLKARSGYETYREMIHLYALKSLVSWAGQHDKTLRDLPAEFRDARRESWTNLGGQLIPNSRLSETLEDIKSGRLPTWATVHRRYEELAEQYPKDRATHAFACLCSLHSSSADQLTETELLRHLRAALRINRQLLDRVRESRAKDYTEEFRSITYDSPNEMGKVIGSLETNAFIRHAEHMAQEFEELAAKVCPQTLQV